MSKQIDHQHYREALIDGAIKAGAKYDLGGITNQTIAEMSGQSVPYIYRYFLDRDDLILKAFFNCDKNFFDELTKNLPILSDKTLAPKMRFYRYMDAAFDYAVKDFDYCKFYIRYYYSNANTKAFRMRHREIGQKFFANIVDYFDRDIDTDRVMHHLFSIVVINVMDMSLGIIADTEEERHIIYDRMYDYIKRNAPKGKGETDGKNS